jgi:Cu/Ag efflux pump CusA
MEKRAPFVHVRAWVPPLEADALVPTVSALPESASVHVRKTEDLTELLVRAAPSTDATKLARAIAHTLEARPGVVFDLTSPQVELPSEMRAVRVRVLGPDLETLKQIAEAIGAALHDVPGSSSAWVPDARLSPAKTVNPDRALMARLGLNPDVFTDALDLAGDGRVVSTFMEGARRFDIVVRMQPSDDKGLDLARVYIPATDGSLVPLSQLATLTVAPVPWRISRANGSRIMDVYFDTRDGSALEAARRAITTKVKMPPEYSLTITREGD